MINLFHINQYELNTSDLGNWLHGDIVNEFETKFAEYVGAKYACSANSASSLIYLATKDYDQIISVPSCIPPVVPNALEMAGSKYIFYDDGDWVGSAYTLIDDGKKVLVDSAQEVTRNQFRDLGKPNAEMIFSFYPTKPVGGCDGGMIVSDNKEAIESYREKTLNGMSYSENNWERVHSSAGHKMHWNSLSAYIANENLKKLNEKYEILDDIRATYNQEFGYQNVSRHLYRIRVKSNKDFIQEAKKSGIICGIHYTHCHEKLFYKNISIHMPYNRNYRKSVSESNSTVSLPYHERLTKDEIQKVVNFVNGYSK